MGEQCQCQSLPPLREWIGKPSKDPDLCHPCMLPLTANWYEEALEEGGRADLARELSTLRTKKNATVEETAAFMDSVKEKVSPELKARLVELDCSMQCADSE